MPQEDSYGNEFLAYGGDFDDRPTDYRKDNAVNPMDLKRF